MFINPINNFDNPSFGAIKYLYNGNGKLNQIDWVALKNANIRETLENSYFFKLLGAQTDVFISATKSKSSQITDQFKPYTFRLTANFIDPIRSLENSGKTELAIDIPSTTPNPSEFTVRLEKALKKLPDEYHTLLRNYKSAQDEDGLNLDEGIKVFIKKPNNKIRQI